MQLNLIRIWTRVTDPISNIENHDTMNGSKQMGLK